MDAQRTQQKHLKSKLTVTVLISVALIVGALIAFFLLRPDPSLSAQTTEPQSKFSFTGAEGWFQGATNETSMAVFNTNDTMSCFVSVEYKVGTVDIQEEVLLLESAASKRGAGYQVVFMDSVDMTLKTSTGPLSYSLNQSQVTTSEGADKLKAGQEFGIINLDSHHIKVMGYCDEPSELEATLPALRAIQFND